MAIEVVENEVPNTIQCPECEHEIPVDPDWQEEDTFTCPGCSVELQVTGVDPLWIDFAPESADDWDDSEEDDEDEDADEEDDDGGADDDDDSADLDDDDDDDEWGGRVTRRVATLRQPKARPTRRGAEEEMVSSIYLTPEGVDRLRQELDNLQQVRLPKVTAWLSEAMADGFEEEDVTELEEARSELSFVEGRIRKLAALLRSAEVLREPESTDVVQLGSRVTVVESGEEPETYRLVSPAEADPTSGYISDASPLGKALIGHQAGDVVVVASPDGPIEFRVVGIG